VAFSPHWRADPGRLEQVEAELDRLADLKRRFRAQTLPDLLERATAARQELAALEDGRDPVQAAEAARDAAEAEVARIHADLRTARQGAAKPFAAAVAGELQGIGLGDGESGSSWRSGSRARPASTTSGF